ncbi:hypothetical protein [Oryza sativa Japonica Group]|uniref:Uncharacterized protein n=1 Tax=Oryza sativa subsp. japonica TaxID=39947 RepID=Q8LJK8_ORYSJ|nr:hypothetical protein [Oryza sativa Japonica Group]
MLRTYVVRSMGGWFGSLYVATSSYICKQDAPTPADLLLSMSTAKLREQQQSETTDLKNCHSDRFQLVECDGNFSQCSMI